MPDQSQLDSKYFIDRYKFNCPYCNRRHVSYHLTDHVAFDWTDTTPCHAYFVTCDSCGNTSMHLSHTEIPRHSLGSNTWRFEDSAGDLDSRFFHSIPGSHFVLDERIPRVLRELFSEAEGCLKNGYLTGASACLRKLVFELARLEKAPGEGFEARLKSLKAQRKEVNPVYFAALLSIRSGAGGRQRERIYDRWEARHLRLILAGLREVLHEMYVLPAERRERLGSFKAITDLLLRKRAPARTR